MLEPVLLLVVCDRYCTCFFGSLPMRRFVEKSFEEAVPSLECKQLLQKNENNEVILGYVAIRLAPRKSKYCRYNINLESDEMCNW